jgi:hypothetical protein
MIALPMTGGERREEVARKEKQYSRSTTQMEAQPQNTIYRNT